MKNVTTSKNKPREEWLAQMERLWPAIKGSLAQVRKPCIRKNCAACASGQKHPAWILSVVSAGRRSSLYVPEALAGEIQRAIKNGRQIEDLLQKAAIQMVKSYRTTVKKTKKPVPKS
jgi:hypothetical protein